MDQAHHSGAWMVQLRTQVQIGLGIDTRHVPLLPQFQEAADQLTKNLGTIRAAELSPSMLDHLTVKMDGTPVPLVAVAQVARENAKTTLITVFDKKLAVEVSSPVCQLSFLAVIIAKP